MRRTLALIAAALVAGATMAALAPPERAEASSHRVNANNWRFNVANTPTDGLAITWAEYRGARVFKRISIPQIRVFYTVSPTMNDQIGTSGAANVPYHPGSLNVGIGASTIDVRARYQEPDWPDANTYRYDVRYLFTKAGEVRARVYAYGPGLEPNHTYQADFRIDLDVGGSGRDFFLHWRAQWNAPKRECSCPFGGSTDGGAEWLMFDGAQGRGWRIFPRKGEGPDLWAVRYKASEGASDLGTAVFNPGPLANDQKLQYANIVLWYRSHTPYSRPAGCPNDCGTPVVIGPIFRPFSY